jgi:hypothetical protein
MLMLSKHSINKKNISCPQEVAQSAVNHALCSGGHKLESPLPLPLRGHIKKNIYIYILTYFIKRLCDFKN